MRATVFGISGCTNGGKTTTSKKVVEQLKNKNLEVAHICQDDFFKKKELVNQVPHKDSPEIVFYHYDEINAVDDSEMEKFILEASMKNDVVIVEGNMVCELEKIIKLMDHVIFVTMDKDSCEERRKTRNYDPADLPGYFDQIVWPAYLSHYETAKKLQTEGLSISFQNGTDSLDDVIGNTLMTLEKNLMCFIKIQSSEIETKKLENFVILPTCGAVSTFIGTTRNNFKGKKVVSLEYECYESMAYREMRKICQKTKEKFPDVERIAIIHRIGRVDIGESSIAIATSSPHRKEAIEATHFLIDALKTCVPIFKKEVYEDGSKSWKENYEFTDLRKELKNTDFAH